MAITHYICDPPWENIPYRNSVQMAKKKTAFEHRSPFERFSSTIKRFDEKYERLAIAFERLAIAFERLAIAFERLAAS